MWLLKFSSQNIGSFTSLESAQQYLITKYGKENVKNLGEFDPMITIKEYNKKGKRIQKTVRQQNRGKCVKFEVQEVNTKEGWTSTSNYVVEEIPTLG